MHKSYAIVAGLAMLTVGIGAEAQTKQAAPAQSAIVHKVAFQVNDNNPATMTLALNNVQNIVAYYRSKGEKAEIAVVGYGPGLHMFRTDTSPVKDRIKAMSLEAPEVTFAACGNTQTNMSKQESKAVELISEAKVVPSGVVTLIELQGRGYAYIRP